MPKILEQWLLLGGANGDRRDVLWRVADCFMREANLVALGCASQRCAMLGSGWSLSEEKGNVNFPSVSPFVPDSPDSLGCGKNR